TDLQAFFFGVFHWEPPCTDIEGILYQYYFTIVQYSTFLCPILVYQCTGHEKVVLFQHYFCVRRNVGKNDEATSLLKSEQRVKSNIFSVEE
ncbi:MAG: hypothetical protein IJ132_03535, partial [Firmicutes bacterium]|nr:hypothetical protein [Bacillota bacterium]